MAKGKGKKKKKEEEGAEQGPSITEVDKTFYELQITDLNRKLARLRSLTADLEEKNSDLEQRYSQLDEDRADVIAYLKKQLGEKQNEAKELQERLYALQEAKDNDTIQFEIKVKEMDEEYKSMKEQLTSEIKLITGKLNALEEFRIHREDLMKKYLDQEKAIEEQEIRHKRVLYDAEKNFIMSKDTIKKDMEKRIIELARDFQSANEIRIAATTHRVIRENIAINNEMDKLIEIIERLTSENEDLKFKNRNLKQNCDLYMEERNNAMGTSKIHRGIINQLKNKYKKLFSDIQDFKKEVKIARDKESELYECKKKVENLEYKVRILEQHVHAAQCETAAAKTMLKDAQLKSNQLKGVLFEAVDAIEQSLRVTLRSEDESEKYSKREALLYFLLRLINEGHQEIVRSESTETLESVKAAYIRGDLGFVPKTHITKRQLSTLKLHMDTQVGKSLEDLNKIQSEVLEEPQSQISLFGRFTRESVKDESEESIESAQSSSAVLDESISGKSARSSKIEEPGESKLDTTMSKIEEIERVLEEESVIFDEEIENVVAEFEEGLDIDPDPEEQV